MLFLNTRVLQPLTNFKTNWVENLMKMTEKCCCIFLLRHYNVSIKGRAREKYSDLLTVYCTFWNKTEIDFVLVSLFELHGRNY